MSISQIAANHVADSTMTTAQIMTPDLEGLWLLIKTFGLAEFHCKRFRISAL